MISGQMKFVSAALVASIAIASCGGGSDDQGEDAVVDAVEVTTPDEVEAETEEETETTVASTEAPPETTPPTDAPTTTTTTTSTTTTTTTTTTTLPATMPNVVGMTIEDARAELTPYNVRITTDNKIDPAPAGQVIDQAPLGGADFSTDVTLTVSVAPPTVPDVSGESIGDALEVLENLGFTVEQTDEFDETAADGLVLAQDPAAGTENAGNVTLTVSRRPVVVFLDELTQVSQSRTSFGTYDSNGTTYDRSLLMGTSSRSESSVEYNLSRDYRQFVTSVGLSDTAELEMVARFNVLGDGRLLQTADVAFGSTLELDIDVTDVLRLQIEYTVLDGRGAMIFGKPRLYGVEGEISQ